MGAWPLAPPGYAYGKHKIVQRKTIIVLENYTNRELWWMNYIEIFLACKFGLYKNRLPL